MNFRLLGHRRGGLVWGVLFLITFAGTHSDAAERYTLRSLGTLAGESSVATSQARDINNRGQIAGWSDTPKGQTHAFLYSAGRMADLGTLGGNNSFAYALNDSGVVVGAADTAQGTGHAFVHAGGRMVDLGTLGGKNSEARGINGRTQIVGWAQTADGSRHAFLSSGGRMVDLGTLGGPSSEAHAINDAGEIVGWSQTRTGETHAFLYVRNRMLDMGGCGENSYARAINRNTDIVGVWDLFSPERSTISHAALFEPAEPLDLGRLGGFESYSYAVNDAGQVAGASFNLGDEFQIAFVWDRAPGIRDLYRLTDDYASGKPAWDHLGEAFGINNRGEIVGVGFKKMAGGLNCICAFVATPVR